MITNPTEEQRQLALTIYRFSRGCLFNVLKYLVGVSQSLATQCFNKVAKVMVRYLYDDFVKTPQTGEEWVKKFKSFMENYEFPFVGALGGLHARVLTHLKNHFNLKNKYTITSIGLIGHNKRFLHLIGIRGIIHDASLQQYSTLFQESRRASIILNKHINVRDAGEIPIVTTISDSAFQRLRWLIKGFKRNTRNQKERFF